MPEFTPGLNIAMKIPKADYARTVAFYRDTLGLNVRQADASDAPTVAETHTVEFGPMTLWLDRVDTCTRAELWLQLQTDDLPAAVATLAATGVRPCDEVEPLPSHGTRTHWIKNPAGIVHLLSFPPDPTEK
ncbi:VOC family protein [Bailinhaonella thermotolerans]|uniref:VOC domain-containing protein n=1 Tax=Bailinhaonella thermotolerans TaxID=1070861 RepID=A0A3A4BLG6_9ACTN|nr:VOC family protein [Bailinhaonella thermotolerans]RJL31872.1 hypothetical protein D5H75_15530 [Bailinhaonella thermotolerans]